MLNEHWAKPDMICPRLYRCVCAGNNVAKLRNNVSRMNYVIINKFLMAHKCRRAVDVVMKSENSASAIDSAADNLTAARLNAHLQSYSDSRTLIASQLNDLKQKQQQLNSR